MKKIFVDIYLAFNLGDDLFLDILVSKYPDCQFTVNYLGSDYDSFLSTYNNVSRRKYSMLNKIGQRLKIKDSITNYNQVAEEHDGMIFIGGSIFREETYHDKLYQDRCGLVNEFKKRHKPVFVMGANFGPYQTDNFYADYEKLFSACDDVCFRDSYSYDLFKHLPQVRFASDIVFQKDVTKYKKINKKEIVGISVIDPRHKNGMIDYYDSYLNYTVEVIEQLVKSGYDCCLMSFCEKEGDLELIEAITVGLTKTTREKVSVFEYKGDMEKAIELIASFKLLIAGRFHANILAMILGTGLIPVIYSSKTMNVLEDMALEKLAITMQNLYLLPHKKTIEAGIKNKIMINAMSLNSTNHFSKFESCLGVEKREELSI